MSYSGPPIYHGTSKHDPNVFVLDKKTRIDVTSFELLGTGGSSFAFKSRGPQKMILKLCFLESLTTALGREIIGSFPFFNRFKGEPIVWLTKTRTDLSTEKMFKLEINSLKRVNKLSTRESVIVLTPDNNIEHRTEARKFSGNFIDSGIFDFNGFSHQFQILLGKIGVDFTQLIGKKIGVIAIEDETEEFPLKISDCNNKVEVAAFKVAAFKAWFELCLNGIMHLDPNLKNFIFKRNGDRSIEARLIDFASINTLTGFRPGFETPLHLFNRVKQVFSDMNEKVYDFEEFTSREFERLTSEEFETLKTKPFKRLTPEEFKILKTKPFKRLKPEESEEKKKIKDLKELYDWLPKVASLLFVDENTANNDDDDHDDNDDDVGEGEGGKRKRGGKTKKQKSRKCNKQKSKTYKKKHKKKTK